MEKQSKAEALIRKQHWHEEVLFYKQIIEEVIEHRGKPMDELMEHLVAKLDQEKAKFHLKRQEMVVKLKKAWLKTKVRTLGNNFMGMPFFSSPSNYG
jgi:hypothetical protein